MPTPLEQAIAEFQALREQGPPPQVSDDPYAAARAEFGGLPWGPVLPGNEQGTVESDTGKIMYPNGVIVDMITGQLVDGSWQTNPDIEGSRAWLIAIQSEWSDKKANTWRERLSDLGYIPEGGLAETGGMALDLVNALALYHTTRYLNGGTAPRVSPQKTTTGIRKAFDPMVLKDEVKSWGQIAFGEDLDDDTAKFFADRVMDVAVRLQKQHPTWSQEQAIGSPSSQYGPATGAYARVEKEFTETPGVKGTLRDLEQLEGNTSLRENMVSLSQVVAT